MQNQNSPIFILEGPDCTGKSTLAKTLAAVYNIPLLHCTYFKEDKAMVEQFSEIHSLIHSKSTLGTLDGCIADRYIFSNIVYGDIYQNGKYVSTLETLLNSELLNGANVQIIFTLPNSREEYLNFYASKYSEREEMYSLESAGKVWDGFNDLLTNPNHKFAEQIKKLKNIHRYDMFEAMRKGTLVLDPSDHTWKQETVQG